MDKGPDSYTAMLKKLESTGKLFDSGPYKWKAVDPNKKGEKEVLFGICGGCMQRDCATLVMGLYNPYRVKTPLVRTNPEKGLDVDPMWKEVTWDEALDLVAERLKEVREKDPRGFVMCEGWGNRDTILRPHFVHAYGSPNEIGSHGPLCTVHYASCLVQAAFPIGIVDLEHCQYHVTLGRSVGPNFSTNTTIRKLSKALDRGMKLVVVDPRCSPEASKGEWIPIRPGTDLAFLLSMAHVMLHEIKIWDTWFLENRTNSPYLIGPDGYYVKDPEGGKPMMWDPVENVPKPFDAQFSDMALTGSYTVDGVECRTAFDMVCEEFEKYTPEWAEENCTVPAETTRRIAKEFVEHAQIGSTMEIDGFTFPFRPVSLNTERNVTNHRGGTYADLTGKIINMLVGNIEVPGGNMTNGPRGPYLAPGEDGIVRPDYEAVGVPFKFPPDHMDCAEFYPNRHTTPHLVAMAILNPGKYYHDYEVEAWMTSGSNPVRAQPGLWVDVFKNIPFHFSIAYNFDEPTIMADAVLPEHSFMERFRVEVFARQHQAIDDEVNGLHMIQLRQPVPAIFNTRHTDEILMDRIYDLMNKNLDFISKIDGFNLTGEYQLDINKRYTLEEIFDRQIRSWRHNKKGWGLAELMNAGFLPRWVSRKEFYNYYWVPGKKTRHPFYFEHLKATGDTLRANLEKHGISFPGVDDMDHIFDLYGPVPHWVENSEFKASEEYDLWATNWRTLYYSNDASNIAGNPWLAELNERDPTDGTICMNVATGKKRGFSEGDTVIVESRYGKVEGRVHLSELFHLDTVGISGCHGLGTPG
jgi:anaerobic selenocysteine-containing dehydrogenase